MRPVEIITKIISYYCFFYVIVKIIGIFKGMWLLPNLIIILGLLLLGVAGMIIIKKRAFNWGYIVIGVVLISALRYYEADLLAFLNQYFAS